MSCLLVLYFLYSGVWLYHPTLFFQIVVYVLLRLFHQTLFFKIVAVFCRLYKFDLSTLLIRLISVWPCVILFCQTSCFLVPVHYLPVYFLFFFLLAVVLYVGFCTFVLCVLVINLCVQGVGPGEYWHEGQ